MNETSYPSHLFVNTASAHLVKISSQWWPLGSRKKKGLFRTSLTWKHLQLSAFWCLINWQSDHYVFNKWANFIILWRVKTPRKFQPTHPPYLRMKVKHEEHSGSPVTSPLLDLRLEENFGRDILHCVPAVYGDGWSRSDTRFCKFLGFLAPILKPPHGCTHKNSSSQRSRDDLYCRRKGSWRQ